MRSKTLIIALICVGMIACKSENKDSNKQKDSLDKSVFQKEQVESSDLTSTRAMALQTIEYRTINDTNKAFSSVVADVWHYEFIFDAKSMSVPEPYDGHWIDFKDDLTYDYGSYDSVEGSGRYHYSFEKGVLITLDNDTSVKPDEWELKLAGNSLVMVGQASYNSNSKQAKLLRQVGRPVQR